MRLLATIMLALPLSMLCQTPDELFSVGVEHLNGNRWAEARDVFSRLIQTSQDADVLGSAYHNRGVARRNMDDIEGALSDYGHALHFTPKSIGVFVNRANLLLDRKDYTHAIEDCTSALEVEPTFLGALTTRAAARYFAGDIEGSLQDYSSIVDLQPESSLGYLGRGTCKMHFNDFAGAASDFSKALEIEPTHKRARQALERAKSKVPNQPPQTTPVSAPR
jgi:tetratricopeptide (TPR) repeat protein